VVFHQLEQSFDGLAAEVVGPARAQSVSLVDEEHAAQRVLRRLRRFDGRLPDVAGDEAGAVGLDEVAAPERAERAVDLREQARYGRLAGAGVAVEDEVARDGSVFNFSPRACAAP
jgi:hypothetical protein